MVCIRCKSVYEVCDGIPILVHMESLPDHLKKQVVYFDREDQTRGDWQLEPWQERYLRNFLTYGKPKKDGLIVDDATGSGYMTIELARRGFKVIATDLTIRKLLKLKNILYHHSLHKRVLLVCCDSQYLPIASGVADGLAANAIMEHLPKEKQAIKEINRIMKTRAPLMLAMPLAYRYILPFLWPVNWWHDRRIGHLRRYTRDDIIGKFKGFQELTTYYTGGIVKVFFLLIFVLTRMSIWNKIGEWADEKFQRFPYGANNIVVILKKSV